MNRIRPYGGKKAPPSDTGSVEIQDLLWNFGNWLTREDEHSDTIISSRVRLARNLHGVPFPNRASRDQLEGVQGNVRNACERSETFDKASYFEINDLREWDCKYFVERRLASPRLIDNAVASTLIIGAREDTSVMVNEEDHLRLQCIEAGLGIQDAWTKISKVDDELEEHLAFCYSKNYGYLTACPTNLGTGMRVSIIVHLPGLSAVGEVNDVIENLPASEIAVRGFYGEGTESIGNVYQISNQLTLGRTESNVIERMIDTASKLTKLERTARDEFMSKSHTRLEDMVFRALAILKSARIMTSLEAMDLLSAVRFGRELGIVDNISRLAINQLMVLVQPAHLQKIYDRDLNAEDRDICRAEFIQQNLQAL